MNAKSHKSRGALAESLTYWFFRLNGFFTIENFILHRELKDTAPGMRTDADLIGVRFPYRNEQGMKDFAYFSDAAIPILVIAEATAGGDCKVNGAWSKPERGNLARLLSAIGLFEPADVQTAAHTLYERCEFRADNLCVQYVALGFSTSKALSTRFPSLLQITWAEALGFIHDRFHQFRLQKADHGTWRDDGLELWNNSESPRNRFVNRYLELLAPPTTNTRN